MPNSYDPDRISALRALSKSGDDDGFRQAVDLHAERGLPIEEIQQAIQASEWRYVVEGCGTSVALERRSELLGYYDEMLEQIEEALATMTDLDDVRGGPKGMLRHLEEREELGKHCFEALLEGRRVLRYLSPEDDLPDPKHDIGQLLSKSGFRWDGAYEVEKVPGENEQIFNEAVKIMEYTLATWWTSRFAAEE
ncbi:hypothetical protein [Sinorhizobium sp. BJ1]|uniref:hypothetical protein n=1 Tax=Sinorhizobium sp. BJ1 TaxID=2035455 RepID=UPI000BEA0F3F|nr:hypothetical protein [Sinorhizobium sp. BJ1]PDT81850.1 hypothetical protein CO676_20000 [Sinorhizobium sp. BJ1]